MPYLAVALLDEANPAAKADETIARAKEALARAIELDPTNEDARDTLKAMGRGGSGDSLDPEGHLSRRAALACGAPRRRRTFKRMLRPGARHCMDMACLFCS